jgi:hypothetical protein
MLDYGGVDGEIFEADFLPCSYGFRPQRRAHDAVAEVRHFTARSYEWIVEGDIKACFDEISHPALMERVRMRTGWSPGLSAVRMSRPSALPDPDGRCPQVQPQRLFGPRDHHAGSPSMTSSGASS